MFWIKNIPLVTILKAIGIRLVSVLALLPAWPDGITKVNAHFKDAHKTKAAHWTCCHYRYTIRWNFFWVSPFLCINVSTKYFFDSNWNIPRITELVPIEFLQVLGGVFLIKFTIAIHQLKDDNFQWKIEKAATPPIYLHLIFAILQFEISSLMNWIFP